MAAGFALGSFRKCFRKLGSVISGAGSFLICFRSAAWMANRKVLSNLLPAILPEANNHLGGDVCRPLKSIRLLFLSTQFNLHLGQIFHPAAVTSGNLVGQKGKCFPFWFGQIVVCMAKSESAFRFEFIESVPQWQIRKHLRI